MPAPFPRRENATNGAQHSGRSCGYFTSVPVANQAVALVQVEMPVGGARPFRVAGSAPPRMARANKRHALGQRQSHPVGSQWCLGPPSGLALASRRLPVGGAREGVRRR
jgi:hypothetical protein